MSSIRNIALLALATGLASVTNAQSTSGSGKTTRYWDCAKGSCSWPGKADVINPVTICGIDDKPLTDYNEPSSTNGGNGYMCSDQSPWAVSDTLAYGFAAVSIPGGSEASWCCACYELTFTTTDIAGKKMIVQATNTGADLAGGQFDLAIPGGGVGIYNACTKEWGAPSAGWGQQYGGISSNTCSTLPSALQPGCNFRFGDWFKGADNPDVEWKTVTCPKEITDKSGCVRSGETPTGDSASTAAAAYSSSSAAPVASSSSAAAYTSAAPVESSSSSEAAYSTPAAPSSTEAAPVESATSAPPYSAPAASSSASEVAPVASSSPSAAAPVESSSAASSYAAPSSSEYASSVATGSSSVPAATSDSPAPTGYAPGGEQCEVQYVYEE